MAKPARSKEILWTNLSNLMLHHWKEINLWQLAKRAKIGPATATRIKEQKTSIGLDILDRVAALFGLHGWQLLIPDLDPENVPAAMISDDEKRLYERLKRAKAVADGEAHPEPEKVTAGR